MGTWLVVWHSSIAVFFCRDLAKLGCLGSPLKCGCLEGQWASPAGTYKLGYKNLGFRKDVFRTGCPWSGLGPRRCMKRTAPDTVGLVAWSSTVDSRPRVTSPFGP